MLDLSREKIIEGLSAVFVPYLSDLGFELIDLLYRYEGRIPAIRLLIDKKGGGISLQECSELNRSLGRVLEEKEFFEGGSFILEVNSPGLDRPLVTARDFQRCREKTVHVFVREPIEGRYEFEGVLLDAGEEGITVQTVGGPVRIPLTAITKGKQIF
ncbi:MAG: ribosome maturation factor RimP [Candidatus Omnitrophica bacterium]|nr:ribosome maturation factor RimP [Candidatus Omnitrophota bacterium]